MANPKMKGVQALWGVGNIYSSEIVTDIRRKDGGEVDFLLDNNGYKNGKIFFDDQTELEVDLIVGTGTVMPSRGDTLAIANALSAIVGTLLIDNVEVKWTQKGWTKMTIPATANVNLTA
jgi:hypothetical protein